MHSAPELDGTPEPLPGPGEIAAVGALERKRSRSLAEAQKHDFTGVRRHQRELVAVLSFVERPRQSDRRDQDGGHNQIAPAPAGQHERRFRIGFGPDPDVGQAARIGADARDFLLAGPHQQRAIGDWRAAGPIGETSRDRHGPPRTGGD